MSDVMATTLSRFPRLPRGFQQYIPGEAHINRLSLDEALLAFGKVVADPWLRQLVSEYGSPEAVGKIIASIKQEPGCREGHLDLKMVLPDAGMAIPARKAALRMHEAIRGNPSFVSATWPPRRMTYIWGIASWIILQVTFSRTSLCFGPNRSAFAFVTANSPPF